MLQVDERQRRAVRRRARRVGARRLAAHERVVGLELEVVPRRLELERVGPQPRVRRVELLREVSDELLRIFDGLLVGLQPRRARRGAL